MNSVDKAGPGLPALADLVLAMEIPTPVLGPGPWPRSRPASSGQLRPRSRSLRTSGGGHQSGRLHCRLAGALADRGAPSRGLRASAFHRTVSLSNGNRSDLLFRRVRYRRKPPEPSSGRGGPGFKSRQPDQRNPWSGGLPPGSLGQGPKTHRADIAGGGRGRRLVGGIGQEASASAAARWASSVTWAQTSRIMRASAWPRRYWTTVTSAPTSTRAVASARVLLGGCRLAPRSAHLRRAKRQAGQSSTRIPPKTPTPGAEHPPPRRPKLAAAPGPVSRRPVPTGPLASTGPAAAHPHFDGGIRSRRAVAAGWRPDGRCRLPASVRGTGWRRCRCCHTGRRARRR